MIRISDDELNHYGILYTRNNIGSRLPGVTFGRFLRDPQGFLQAACFSMPLPLTDDDGFYPLLPAQDAVFTEVYKQYLYDKLEEKAEAEMGAQVRRRGQCYVEPLRHHSYKANTQRDPRRIAR